MALIDFTLSNARRFYSSMGNPLGVRGLRRHNKTPGDTYTNLHQSHYAAEKDKININYALPILFLSLKGKLKKSNETKLMLLPFFLGPLHTTASSRLSNKKPIDMIANL